MRHTIAGLLLLAASALPGHAATYVNIGINLPSYPRLVPVPGYPVYYAPSVNSNYFFYDGLYWDFDGDNWYASSWYNGPWQSVDPLGVPAYLLRVPVRYYRQPPAYFRGWRADTSPRWQERWGRDWEQRHSGWSQWRGEASPSRAPLPYYQRAYSGESYPQVERQREMQAENYRYQPRDKAAREHFEERGRGREREREERDEERGENRGKHRGEKRHEGRNEERDRRER